VVLPFALKRRPRQEWILELQRHGILAGESRSYADVLADEQVQHNDTIESIRLPNNRIALIPRTPFHLWGGAAGSRTRRRARAGRAYRRNIGLTQ
jgi:crotonobetainyl-CoA:carnitine CoA-transferase CaiB-like acyl-CoA transferase